MRAMRILSGGLGACLLALGMVSCAGAPPPGQEEYDLGRALWLASGSPSEALDHPLLGEDQMLTGLRREPGEGEVVESSPCRKLLGRLEELGVIVPLAGKEGRAYSLTPCGSALYARYREQLRTREFSPDEGEGHRLQVRQDGEDVRSSKQEMLRRLLQRLLGYQPRTSVGYQENSWKVRARKEKP